MPTARRITHILYGGLIVVAGTFVIGCIVQVALVLFSPDHGIRAPRLADGPCKARIAELSRSLKQGPGAEEVDSATLQSLYAVCRDEPNGLDAAAALARLNRMTSSDYGTDPQALTEVRQTVESFIR